MTFNKNFVYWNRWDMCGDQIPRRSTDYHDNLIIIIDLYNNPLKVKDTKPKLSQRFHQEEYDKIMSINFYKV